MKDTFLRQDPVISDILSHVQINDNRTKKILKSKYKYLDTILKNDETPQQRIDFIKEEITAYEANLSLLHMLINAFSEKFNDILLSDNLHRDLADMWEKKFEYERKRHLIKEFELEIN